MSQLHFMETRSMSVQNFIQIPDNPRQRDTVLHASKALKKHLKEPYPTHMKVSVAKLPNGKMYKLDGHTRAYLWKNKKLEPYSNNVLVDIYKVKTMEEVKGLYTAFDNSDAAETGKDIFFGAMNENSIKPKSELLKKGGFNTALGILSGANKKEHTYRNVNEWAFALEAIDKQHFKYGGNMVTGLILACIILYTIEGEKSFKFWHAFCNNQGKKDGRQKDAVQMLTELKNDRRNWSETSAHPWESAKALAAKAISYYYGYQSDKVYIKKTAPVDIEEYIQLAKTKKNETA